MNKSINIMSKNSDINRLKLVLVEKKRTNKWLAEKLDKDQATISKWCTNTCQPDLKSLMKISQLLEVDITELIRFDGLSVDSE
jgi:transcriptional regulator with XRE-family HTH domain